MTRTNQNRWSKQAQIAVLLQSPAVSGDQAIAQYIYSNASFDEVDIGEVIITQGASDTDVIFLLSGDVDIIVNGIISTERSAPWTVGEMSAVNQKHPRSASVVVKSDHLAFVRLPANKFLKLCENHPDFRKRLDQNIQDRFQERLKIPIPTMADEKKQDGKSNWPRNCALAASAIFIISLCVYYVPDAKLQLGIIIASFLAIAAGMFLYWRHEKFFYKSLIRVWIGAGIGVLVLSFRLNVSKTEDGASFWMNIDNVSPTIIGIAWMVGLGFLLWADYLHSKKFS